MNEKLSGLIVILALCLIGYGIVAYGSVKVTDNVGGAPRVATDNATPGSQQDDRNLPPQHRPQGGTRCQGIAEDARNTTRATDSITWMSAQGRPADRQKANWRSTGARQVTED